MPIKFLFICFFIFFLSACGGGGNSQPPTPPAEGIIQGSVLGGLYSGGSINAYSLENPTNEPLATTSILDNGKFVLTISALAQPLLIVATGGTYFDPSSFQFLEIEPEFRMSTIILFNPGETHNTPITPFTHLAVGLLLYSNKDNADKITDKTLQSAFNNINETFLISASNPDLKITPDLETKKIQLDGDEKQGLIIVALTRIAHQEKLKKIDVLKKLYNLSSLNNLIYEDIISDGILNGKSLYEIEGGEKTLAFGNKVINMNFYRSTLATSLTKSLDLVIFSTFNDKNKQAEFASNIAQNKSLLFGPNNLNTTNHNIPLEIQLSSKVNEIESDNFILEFQLENLITLKKITIDIDKQKTTYEPINVYNSSTNTYSIPIASTEYKDGKHDIKIIVVDKLENTGTIEASIVFDNTPPVLNITSEDLTNNNDFTLLGTVDDKYSDIQTISINDESAEISDDTQWEKTVSLNKGLNEFIIVAIDVQGNSTQLEAEVFFSETAPVTTITSPKLTNLSSFTLQGKYTNGKSSVTNFTVNGENADIDLSNNQWSKLVSLSAGINDFVIGIEDMAGNITDFNTRVLLDDIAPQLSTTTFNTITENKLFLLEGTYIEQESGIREIKLNSNNSVSFKNGTWSKLVELNEGENEFIFRIEDNASNYSEKIIRVTLIDTALMIVLTSPTTSNLSEFTLEGEFYSRNSNLEFISINGENISRIENNKWSKLVSLQPGVNNFTIEAKNILGNYAKVDIEIFLNNSPLNIIIEKNIDMKFSKNDGTYYVSTLKKENNTPLYIEVDRVNLSSINDDKTLLINKGIPFFSFLIEIQLPDELAPAIDKLLVEYQYFINDEEIVAWKVRENQKATNRAIFPLINEILGNHWYKTNASDRHQLNVRITDAAGNIASETANFKIQSYVPDLLLQIKNDQIPFNDNDFLNRENYFNKELIAVQYSLSNPTNSIIEINISDNNTHFVTQNYNEVQRENKVELKTTEAWRKSDISELEIECPTRLDIWQPVSRIWNRLGAQWIETQPKVNALEIINVFEDSPSHLNDDSTWQDFQVKDTELAPYVSMLLGQTLSYSFDFISQYDPTNPYPSFSQPNSIKHWQLTLPNNGGQITCPDIVSIQTKSKYNYLEVEGYPRNNMIEKTETQEFPTTKFSVMSEGNNINIKNNDGWYEIPANTVVTISKYIQTPELALHNDLLAEFPESIKDYQRYQLDKDITWSIAQDISITTRLAPNTGSPVSLNLKSQNFNNDKIEIIKFDRTLTTEPKPTPEPTPEPKLEKKPNIIPSDQGFLNFITVTITSDTLNSKIYYTLDNSEPTESSLEYSKPFKLTQSTVIKAKSISQNNMSNTSSEFFSVVKQFLHYNFDNDTADWITVNDSTGLSNWKITNSEFIQSNERGIVFYGSPTDAPSSFDGTYHLGTFAYLSTGFELVNYHFSADITPLQDSNWYVVENGHDIGVMFRYTDKNNYYRVSLNSAYGFARLEKKFNGVFTTLATDNRGYEAENQVIKIVIEVLNNLFQIYINGEARFSIFDSDLSEGSVALYTQDGAKFDNIIIRDNSKLPSITIESPLSFSVTDSNQFTVSAVAMNVPIDSSIEINLNNQSCKPLNKITSGYYQAKCSSVAPGNHTLTARIIDNNSQAIAIDTNQLVGSSGEKYIAIGDSITNGIGDKYSSDNKTLDGKIISSQGFEAALHNLLNTNRSTPQLVINEGVPGEASAGTFNNRINSILERHNDANRALIMIGTNDSSGSTPVESGIGCAANECDGTYKGNMQALIKVLLPQVTPIIAIPPPVFNGDTPLTSTRNLLIRDYATVINNELDNHQIGPDFYTYFLTEKENRISLFINGLHPNAMGHVLMAHLWSHNLNGNSNLPSRSQLPLVLEDICVRLNSEACVNPLTYQQNYLEADGDPYYVDEKFSIVDVPTILLDGIWLSTANSDTTNSRTDYLTFTTDRDINIYIAYDSQARKMPDWLINFSDTDVKIEVTNPNAPEFNLYRKTYLFGIDTPNEGTIQLGGNLSQGAAGSKSNYLVIVKQL